MYLRSYIAGLYTNKRAHPVPVGCAVNYMEPNNNRLNNLIIMSYIGCIYRIFKLKVRTKYIFNSNCQNNLVLFPDTI